jgi:hypothetical protein
MPEKEKKIPSENLAALIVDALHHAHLIKDADIERAIAIAKEEIDVRKSLGDY